jgi:hypothetical protein
MDLADSKSAIKFNVRVIEPAETDRYANDAQVNLSPSHSDRVCIAAKHKNLAVAHLDKAHKNCRPLGD